MNSIHIIDIVIIVIYLITCIIIGFYKSKSIKTLKEYTLGKGCFPNIVIITTLFATHIGAANLMGSIEQVYALGMFFVAIRLVSPLFWLIIAKVYGENIEQFRGCMSLSDIMKLLYGEIGKRVTNIVSISLATGIVPIQATAMGYLVNYFFDISYSCSVIFSILIIAIYLAFGGIRAVAFTDVFQFAVLMIAIPIAFSSAYHDVGGYKGIFNSLPRDMVTLNLNKDNILLFLTFIFHALLPRSSGVYVQRFLICRDSIQLIHCLNVIAIISLFFSIFICMIGLILKIKEPNMDPQIVFLYFITHNVAVGFKGLIIAGLLAVIMSTADSWLNTTSALFTHDIIRTIIPLTERKALLVAKTCAFLISTLAIDKNELVEMQWLFSNFWSVPIFIPLIAGSLKFRTNSKSFISAITLSISFTAISGYMVGNLGTISLICGMIGNAIGLFGMHYWQLYRGSLNVALSQGAAPHIMQQK